MNGKSASIVIADDDQDVCGILSMFLESQGHRVVEAYDGLQAWQAIEKNPPDIAVLDIMMPGMSGLDLCRKMRGLPRYRSIPVIMISALAREEDILRGFRSGATDYITKPFVNAEVLARIRSVLRRLEFRRRQEKGRRLSRFNEQLRRLLTDVNQPLRPMLRDLKRLRDLAALYEIEGRSAQAVYQQGLRMFMILTELEKRRNEIRDRVVKLVESREGRA